MVNKVMRRHVTWPTAGLPHDPFNNTRVGGGRHLWATNIDPTETNNWQPNQSRGFVRRNDEGLGSS